MAFYDYVTNLSNANLSYRQDGLDNYDPKTSIKKTCLIIRKKRFGELLISIIKNAGTIYVFSKQYQK